MKESGTMVGIGRETVRNIGGILIILAHEKANQINVKSRPLPPKPNSDDERNCLGPSHKWFGASRRTVFAHQFCRALVDHTRPWT